MTFLLGFQYQTQNLSCLIGCKCNWRVFGYHHGFNAAVAPLDFSRHVQCVCSSCISKQMKSQAYTQTIGKEAIWRLEDHLTL